MSKKRKIIPRDKIVKSAAEIMHNFIGMVYDAKCPVCQEKRNVVYSFNHPFSPESYWLCRRCIKKALLHWDNRVRDHLEHARMMNDKIGSGIEERGENES